MAGRQRWWVGVTVCGALSVVPFAAAVWFDTTPRDAVAVPSPPPALAEPEDPPTTAEPARMDAPPAIEDEEEEVAEEQTPADEPAPLDQSARLAGRVVDERGFAVTRFEVAVESFWPAREEDRRKERLRLEVEDDDGRFELEGLAPGGYVLAVRADGYPPTTSDRRELAAGDDERGLRIALVPGGTVEGRVHHGGAPIAGARVTLDLASGAFGATASAVSDDSGGYRIEGVPTSGPVSLRFQAAGYATRILSAISARAGRVTRHDVELTQGEASLEYAGVGASLSADKQGIVFGHVMEGGPAEQAGILKGDRLVRVDGDDARGWTMAQAVQRLRGSPGSRVSIRVHRAGSDHEVIVTRDRVVR